MNSMQLQNVKEEKDLGIIISDDLKWDKQCIAAVKQGNKVLGMIKRNFVDRSKDTIMALCKSLVRPHLEYCTPIWSPHLIKDIKLVEGVQRSKSYKAGTGHCTPEVRRGSSLTLLWRTSIVVASAAYVSENF